MTKTLLRAGVKLVGFGTPIYLLTVRGRKSGQPRTTPVSPVEYDGKRYLMTPYGVVDWVRNLRAAGEATLTRLCLDQLQLARRQREMYVGPWLPEPILTAETPEAADPEPRT